MLREKVGKAEVSRDVGPVRSTTVRGALLKHTNCPELMRTREPAQLPHSVTSQDRPNMVLGTPIITRILQKLFLFQ